MSCAMLFRFHSHNFRLKLLLNDGNVQNLLAAAHSFDIWYVRVLVAFEYCVDLFESLALRFDPEHGLSKCEQPDGHEE